MKKIILTIAAAAMLAGCTTTKYVEVERVKSDTIYKRQLVRDSVIVHDSTIIERVGDTVYIRQWRDRWRDRLRIDTLYQSKTDSIPVPVEVIKEVPAALTWWQQTRIHLGTAAIAMLAIIAAVKILRKRLL